MTILNLGDGHAKSNDEAEEVTEEEAEEEAKETVEETEVETPEESSTSEETPEEETEEATEEVADEDTESGVEPETEPETEPAKKVVDESTIQGLQAEYEKINAKIIEARKERRGLKQERDEPLFVSKKEDLEGVAEEDISLIEKVLKAKGYVQKSELQATSYREQLNNETEAWLEKHPRYKPENDPEDKNWNELQEELNTFYKAPTDPKQIQKILDRVHSSISPKSSLPVKNPATVAAAKQKITSKGSGGTGAKTSIKTKGNIDLSMLHGFTEEELAEMQS